MANITINFEGDVNVFYDGCSECDAPCCESEGLNRVPAKEAGSVDGTSCEENNLEDEIAGILVDLVRAITGTDPDVIAVKL